MGDGEGVRGEADRWRRQLEAIVSAVSGGCQLVQIREKDLSGRVLTRYVREVMAAIRGSGARVLVNDRVDVALAAGADGVHLRTTSLRTADVRRAFANRGMDDLLIGVSTHSLAEAREAESGGADFVVCGPVWETASKKGMGEPIGLEGLRAVCTGVRIPVIGLGGITEGRAGEVLGVGAAGIAGIGIFQGRQSDNPSRIVTRILFKSNGLRSDG